MSTTTIDERVVEMRFDNKHFESNVATSMSTLDKLKQKLNLSGASKGLEDINAASKRIDMNGLGRSVETVTARFSALQVMGVTALSNITNQAVNAGKRMISALTIDPVKSGFHEYETQMNAVQTILANTSSKGTTINDVTAALDELNTYADMTIYNFTEMTRNIGTFTAAGVDLETSVNAIQGIANLAAVSGSTSQQASTAMYQLSQALAAGTVKLMDWNSVVNAGMGGEVFQNALKETSRLLGTGADEAIKATGSFRESLREEWLTAEVLTETLKKFTSSGAVEYIAEYTGESQEAVNAILEETDAWGNEADAIDKAAEALAKKSGKNKDEIKSALEMAKNAQDAATKVKTFTQLWDVMKEAAQSGWAKTWQIIIGDFEEAKALLTPLSDFVTGIINKMSDWRNDLLDSALGQGIGDLSEKINGLFKPAKSAAEAVTNTVEAVEDLGSIVDKVINGDFGNGADRYNALTEAGINYYKVQNKVNETLGDSYRHSEKKIEMQDQLLGAQTKTVEKTKEEIAETTKLTDAQKEQLKKFAAMTEKQAEAKGYTDEQIKSIKELKAQADQLGVPFNEFIDNLDEINGRWLLFNSFKNIGKGLISVFNSIKKAWVDVFPPKSLEERAEGLFNLIAALSRFTNNIRTKLADSGDEITRTFKGIFAILNIVTTILGGGFKIALKAVSQILSYFNLDILDVTASIGDALVAFHDWFESIFDITGVLDAIVPLIDEAAIAIKEWFAVFKETPAVQKLVDALEAIGDAFDKLTSGEINIGEFASSLGENLAKALKSLPEIAVQIGKDFIAGFQNGIEFSISDIIGNIIDFCTNFVSSFAEALGVQSPSWKAYDTATDFFQGFINGAKNMLAPVISVLKSIGEKIVEILKGLWGFITDENGQIEWDKIFAASSLISMLWILKQFATAFNGIAEAFGGFGDLIENAGRVMKSFSKVLNGVAWDLKAKAILKIAIALGIVAAAFAIVALITKDIDKKTLWNTVGIIAVLALIIVGLAFAMDKLSSASIELDGKSKTLKAGGLQKSLLQIGLTILALAAAVKLIGEMDPEAAKRGFKALAGIAGGLLVFIAIIGAISLYAKDVDDIGSMMLKMSIAIGIMAIACKLIGNLSNEEIGKGIIFVGALSIFIALMTKVAKSAGNNVSKVGGMVLKLSIAMILMVGVCKLVGMLSAEDMLKGVAFAAAFVLFVGALVKATKIGKKQQIASLGGLVLSISTSLLMMVGVCKLVGTLTVGEMVKGGIFVAAFVVLLKYLIGILKVGKEDTILKVSGTILAVSVAIAILAGVAALLGFMPLGGLAKGIAAVGLLSIMMTVMIKSLKGAQNAKGAIMMMAIAIGVMAASIIALSFIPWQDLLPAAGALTAIMLAFAIMVKSLKGLKVDVKTIVAVGILTAVVGALAFMIKKLDGIDPLSAIASAGSLAVLMLTMAAVLKILNTINVNIKNALLGILSLTLMSVPLLALVGVLALMSGVENATANTKSLIALATTLTLLLIPLTIIGGIATTGIGAAAVGLGIAALLLMAVPLLALVGVLALMSGVENATTNSDLLIGLMTTLTDLLIKISLVAPLAIIGVSAMTGLTGFMGAIGVMAVAIGALMGKFPNIQKFLDTGLPVLEQLAGSIGTMIGKFIGGIGEGLSDSLVKMGENIATFMDKLAVASENASGIKGESFNGVKQLMDVMGDIASTTVGTTIGDIFTFGGTSMEKFQKDGVAFFDAMKAIGEASNEANINKDAMESVIGVAQRLADLQSSLEPMGGVISWFTGWDDLGKFGKNISKFINSMITAFGSLEGTTLNTETMGFVITAATELATLQSSLEPMGGVVSWFTGWDDLGKFGKNISSFVSSVVTAFGNVASGNFNTFAMRSIITAATDLADLQSSLEPMGGVIHWFTGWDDLGKFGENISSFISSMVTAFGALDGAKLNTLAMQSVIAAAADLADIQSSLEPMGGVISWFTGWDDLGKFGENIAAFISSMKIAMSASEGAIVNEEELSSIITAAGKLADFQSKLEPMGGVVSWFAGRTDLGKFGNNIGLFASGMAKFRTYMGENGISEEAVTSVMNAGNAMIELQKVLPEEGWFDGKMNLSDFSVYITDFATAMSTFGTKASSINPEAVNMAINTANRIKDLIQSFIGIDYSGVDAFTGIGSGGIGADGPAYDIARAMSRFSEKVADIDTEAVTVAVSSAKTIKNLISSLVGLDTSGIENFKPATIGASLKNYAGFVSKIDVGAVSGSIASANQLKNFIGSLANLDTSGVSSFVSAVEKLGTVNINNVMKAFSGASTKISTAGADMITGLIKGMESKTASVTIVADKLVTTVVKKITDKQKSFYEAGSHLVTEFKNGISDKSSGAADVAKTMADDAAKGARDKYTALYNAGSYLVTGFKNGISDNSYKAAAKATAMAEAAVTAARTALRINSPSKVFKEIGSGIPEGFAMGIGMLGSTVDHSVTDMASRAIDSTRGAMTNVLEALNSDMDAQPVIRPVIDLSDAKTGANAINDMFNGVRTVGVNSSLNAVNSMMDRRNQNGINDDVVSAINKLRRDVGNMDRPSYNINGITYDDGSAVSEAIKVLVREVKVGRRV